MKNLLNTFFKEEKGQGMTEYGLILGLIAIAAVAALTLMGGTLDDKFRDVISDLTGTGAGTITIPANSTTTN